MRPIVERSLLAAGTFVVAALVVGVPVVGGLVCLLVYGIAALVVRGVQRRRQVVRAGRVRDARSSRPRGERTAARPRPPKVVVDDAESYGWPRLTT